MNDKLLAFMSFRDMFYANKHEHAHKCLTYIYSMYNIMFKYACMCAALLDTNVYTAEVQEQKN